MPRALIKDQNQDQSDDQQQPPPPPPPPPPPQDQQEDQEEEEQEEEEEEQDEEDDKPDDEVGVCATDQSFLCESTRLLEGVNTGPQQESQRQTNHVCMYTATESSLWEHCVDKHASTICNACYYDQ